MWAIIGGIVAGILGIIGLTFWWKDFLEILKGMVPIMLLLGGVLAIAIGVDNVRTNRRLQKEREEEEKAKKEAEEKTT